MPCACPTTGTCSGRLAANVTRCSASPLRDDRADRSTVSPRPTAISSSRADEPRVHGRRGPTRTAFPVEKRRSARSIANAAASGQVAQRSRQRRAGVMPRAGGDAATSMTGPPVERLRQQQRRLQRHPRRRALRAGAPSPEKPRYFSGLKVSVNRAEPKSVPTRSAPRPSSRRPAARRRVSFRANRSSGPSSASRCGPATHAAPGPRRCSQRECAVCGERP